jgi:hypothetical protein
MPASIIRMHPNGEVMIDKMQLLYYEKLWQRELWEGFDYKFLISGIFYNESNKLIMNTNRLSDSIASP